ncbi:Deoxyuridine 5'-triphosphate nucleotidohydrolase [Aspergillus fumigatus]
MPSQLNSAVRVHRQTRLTNTCIFLLGQLATLLDKYTAISLSSIHLTISTQVMTKETTPPPQQSKAPTHEPPSLPASPLAKRTKPDSNNTANSNKMTTGTAPAVTSISQPPPSPARQEAHRVRPSTYPRVRLRCRLRPLQRKGDRHPGQG